MTWTPDRPTKPGNYWLSLSIAVREVFKAKGWDASGSFVASIATNGFISSAFVMGTLTSPQVGRLLDGALWRPYVEPADPHAQSVPSLPSLRSQIEMLPWHACPTGGPHIDRCAVLALLESEVTR